MASLAQPVNFLMLESMHPICRDLYRVLFNLYFVYEIWKGLISFCRVIRQSLPASGPAGGCGRRGQQTSLVEASQGDGIATAVEGAVIAN